MIARLAADVVATVHFAFVLFVVFGGLLALKDLRYALLHLPAAAWGTYVTLASKVCPLTPLENRLRQRAGEAGYEGGFIDHYLLPILYPAGLTPGHQRWLGAACIAINVGIYFWALLRARHRRKLPARSE